MNDNKIIKRLLYQVVEKSNLGEPADFSNNDYDILSEQIYSKTGILISARTLNRLFNKLHIKDESYQPQASTKEALAKYVDYKDWGSFKQDYIAKERKEKRINIKAKFFSNNQLFTFFILLIFLIVTIFFFYKKIKIDDKEYENIKLEPNKTNVVAPFTLIFKYNISEIKEDSVFFEISQEELLYYKKDERFYLPKDKHSLSIYIREPMVYRMYLKAESKIVKKETIYGLSDGWKYTVYNNNIRNFGYKPVRIQDGLAISTTDDVYNAGIDTNGSWQSRFINISNFPVLLDECSFVIRFKNNYQRKPYCNFQKLILIGKRSKVVLFLADKECFSKDIITISDTTCDGEFNDLSSLAHDFSQWTKVELKTFDKKSQLFIDNRKSYTTTYKQSLDSLKGILFRFSTTAKLDYIKFFDKDNNLVYGEDFERDD